MYLRHVRSAGLALFMIGLVAPSAQAAPVVGPVDTADAEVAGSLVEKVHGRYHYHSYSPYYYGSHDHGNCVDSCGYTYYWGYGYSRPYHHHHRHYDDILDRYPVPVPPFRNERWWFNRNTE